MMEEIVDLKEWYDRLWYTSHRFIKFESIWMNNPILTMNPEEFDKEIHEMWGISYKLTKIFKTPEFIGPLRVTLKLKSKVEGLKAFSRLIQILTNPGLKPRHFKSMGMIIGIDITPKSTTCLNDIVDDHINLINKHMEKLFAIVNVASREFSLENTYKNMTEDWNQVNFVFVPYKSQDLSVLASCEEIQLLIDDHLVKTKTITSSSLFSEFRIEVEDWYKKLVSTL